MDPTYDFHTMYSTSISKDIHSCSRELGPRYCTKKTISPLPVPYGDSHHHKMWSALSQNSKIAFRKVTLPVPKDPHHFRKLNTFSCRETNKETKTDKNNKKISSINVLPQITQSCHCAGIKGEELWKGKLLRKYVQEERH